MQDLQNIPPPDTDTTARTDEFGSHSEAEDERDERDDRNTDDIPLPPDVEQRAPIEDPPAEGGQGEIDENKRGPEKIV